MSNELFSALHDDGGQVKPYVEKPDLFDQLAHLQCAAKFTPYCYEDERSVTAYFKSSADYSVQLTDRIRLYKALDNDEIVGVRIEKELPDILIEHTIDASGNLRLTRKKECPPPSGT